MISQLAEVTIPSPNRYAPRAYPVTRVTVHHMAGDLSVESCGAIFASASRGASSNYGIDSYGRIGCYVEEEDAAWTSSSYDNDNRAITIEVADEDTANWVPSQAAYQATVELCADICTRYGIEPTYTGDTSGSFTEHMMFAATGCPGPWWHAHMGQFVQDVKNRMEDDEMITEEQMNRIAELCAEKVAESAYWAEDKKAVWGPTGEGGGKYQRNTYNVARFIHDAVCAINSKVDKLLVGGIDIEKLSNAVADKIAARMKS